MLLQSKHSPTSQKVAQFDRSMAHSAPNYPQVGKVLYSVLKTGKIQVANNFVLLTDLFMCLSCATILGIIVF